MNVTPTEWSIKRISITYSDSVFVALGIQHAVRMRSIVICGLSGATIFFHFISQTTRLSKKVTELNFFYFLYTFSLKYFSFREELSEYGPKMCIDLHVKSRYSFPILKTDFKIIYSNTKFHENPPWGSRTDRQTRRN
jgi:hypothetical protein